MRKAIVISLFSCLFTLLRAQEPALVVPLGIMGNVNTVAYSRDNQFILTASEDKTVKLWDARRGRLVHNLQEHTDDVFMADFLPDGKSLISLSRDGSIKIWDMITGEVVHSSQAEVTINARSVTISPDGSLVLTYQENETEEDYGNVCLWDTKGDVWSLLYTLQGTRIGYIKPFVFSPDQKKFAYLANNGFLTIADTRTGKTIQTLQKLTDFFQKTEFSPDGIYFLAASEESVKIWDTKTGKIISEITEAVYFSFSHDARKIVTISKDNIINIYDVPYGNLLQQVSRGGNSVNVLDVQFSPDDSCVLITNMDACLTLVDLQANKTRFVIEGASPAVFSPDGKTILTTANAQMGAWSSAFDQIPKIWDARTGKLLHRLEGHTNYISTAKFSPDGGMILTDSWDRSAKLWDIKNGKLAHSLKGDQLLYKTMDFSADGMYVLTTTNNEIAKLWDVKTGLLLFSMKGDTFVDRPRYGLEFKASISPNSKYIVTSYPSDQYVRVFDIESKALKYTFECPVPVNLVVFNTDGTELAVASGDKKARIWDLSNGQLKIILDDVSNSYTYEEMPKLWPARISPDGSLVITFPYSAPAEVFDAQTGQLLYSLDNVLIPQDPFTPDGKGLITMSGNETEGFTTTLRESKTGNLLRSFKGSVNISRFLSPDKSRIITFSGTLPKLDINVWDLKSGELLRSFAQETYPDQIHFTWDSRKTIVQEINGNAAIRDIASGELLQTISPGTYSFEPVKFSANYRYAFLTSGPGTIDVLDLLNFTPGQRLDWNFTKPESINSVESITTSPDGLFTHTRLSDGTSMLWNTLTGELLQKVKQTTEFIPDAGLEESIDPISPAGPDEEMKDIPLSEAEKETELLPEDSLIIEPVAMIKSPDEGELPAGETPYPSGFKTSGCSLSEIFSPDSKRMLGDCDGSAMIWDIQSSSWLPKLEEAGAYNGNFQFTPDSKRVYEKTGYQIRWWDVLTGKLVLTMDGPFNETPGLMFSSDGSKIINTLAEGKTCVWNTTTGDLLRQFDTIPVSPVLMQADYNSPFSSLEFSPDNNYILTSDESEIKLWDASDGKLLYRSQGESAQNFNAFPFSPDSRTLVANYYGTRDGNEGESDIHAEIRAIPDGTQKFALDGTSVNNSFSPDGKNILTLSQRKKYKLWDSSNGKLRFNFGWDDPEKIAGSAVYSPDGKFLLTSAEVTNSQGYTIKYEPLDLWSTETGKKQQTLDVGSVRTADICWNGGLITSFKNSMISLYEMKTGKKKVSFVAIEGDDYVFVLPSGEYMGTSGGVKYLSWRLNNKLYDFDQWDLQYNRPDKVLEQMVNPDTGLIRLYRKAYEKRLKKAGFTEEMFTSELHTPEAGILNPSEFITPVSDPVINLRVKLSDTKYKLDRLNVWINDVPIAGENGISLREAGSGSIVRDIPLTLSSGPNKIQVSCINEKGVESLKEVAEIRYNPVAEKKPELYVIVMSVSAYRDERYNLRYAVKDGKDMASMFSLEQPELNVFSKIHVDTLFDVNAKKENFFALKQKLLGTNVDDQVVVFISGHGLLDDEMDFYFATQDIDFNDPAKRGISFDDMENLLDSIPARKKLLMVDACHSGEVDKDASNEQVVSLVETTVDFNFRGKVKSYSFKGIDAQNNPSGISLTNSFELMQELFTGLDKGTGTTVISAAAGDGYALESPQWNNGVFTYSIINGIKNRAADKNKDGIITISELKDYSVKQVQLLTDGQQKPTARRESINFDWKIW